MRLNLARALPRSAANGPGERFVLWVQGCPLACPGCWNPDTWAFKRRDLRSVEEVASTILTTEGIEGVTFTGGEPFAQARALAALAERVRAAGLSVFVFTGYDLSELTREEHRALLALTDVVVTGRYIEAERAEGLVWRGSTNQRVHFLSARYSPTDMEGVAEVELHIHSDGGLTVTGFPDAELLTLTLGPRSPLPSQVSHPKLPDAQASPPASQPSQPTQSHPQCTHAPSSTRSTSTTTS